MARQPKPQKNLTHEQVWTALDRLAANSGLSPSALARRSGLDPTTFNNSKRVTADGRERWPSTESVAKALPPGSAAVFALVRWPAADQARPMLAKLGGTVLHTSMAPDAPERIKAELAAAQNSQRQMEA